MANLARVGKKARELLDLEDDIKEEPEDDDGTFKSFNNNLRSFRTNLNPPPIPFRRIYLRESNRF
jgi:hypothetical protein